MNPRRLALVVTAMAIVATVAPRARAGTISLVGVQFYASSNTGANAGGYWQISTNSSTVHSIPSINSQSASAISFSLQAGSNTFNFSTGYGTAILGMNLFFSDTGTSYNPPYVTGVGIPGHLSAYVSKGSSNFSVPLAGVLVNSYNSSSTSFNLAAYSGATSFAVGDKNVAITAFSTNPSASSGSFTLEVTSQTPEPAVPTLVGGLLVLLYLSRRS